MRTKFFGQHMTEHNKCYFTNGPVHHFELQYTVRVCHLTARQSVSNRTPVELYE